MNDRIKIGDVVRNKDSNAIYTVSGIRWPKISTFPPVATVLRIYGSSHEVIREYLFLNQELRANGMWEKMEI